MSARGPASLDELFAPFEHPTGTWPAPHSLLRHAAGGTVESMEALLRRGLACMRLPFFDDSVAEVRSRRELALVLDVVSDRLAKLTPGGAGTCVRVYSPGRPRIALVGRDASGKVAIRGTHACTFGGSLYDAHVELPIDGMGWPRDRVFVPMKDGSELSWADWLAHMGLTLLCWRCGKDITRVMEPRMCAAAYPRWAETERSSDDGERSEAHAPAWDRQRRRMHSKTSQPPQPQAASEKGLSRSRRAMEHLTLDVDGTPAQASALRLHARGARVVLTDPSHGVLRAVIEATPDAGDALPSGPMWSQGHLVPQWRAHMEAKVRSWARAWTLLLVHEQVLRNDVAALQERYRQAAADEQADDAAFADLMRELNARLAEGAISEQEWKRRVSGVRVQRRLQRPERAGQVLWNSVLELVRARVGADVEPWVLARFLDQRR